MASSSSSSPEFFPLVATAAGSGRRGFVDGAALTQAYLDGPLEMVQLPNGRLLLADGRNNCLRLIDLASAGGPDGGGGAGSVVTTLPTHAFLGPRSPVLIDSGAAVVLADSGHNKIRMVQIHEEQPSSSGGANGRFGPGARSVSAARGGGSGSTTVSVEDCTIAGTGRAGHHDGVADVATFNHPV
jgi:hypothetical protein